jgi:uncharacterized membrane protein YgaE (UPF0421/DUF939 family)
VLAPEQILAFGETPTVIGATVTVTVPLLVQPAVVPVTVYVVVLAGLAVTVAPVVEDNPVAGDQV